MVRVTPMYPESWSLARAGDCHGPVDDKGVQVAQLEVLQGCHQIGTDVLWAVVRVPQFGLKKS